ncbi:MAG: hypothetical protein KC594_13300, partial [Nitrospira sp.]|nr:hypothetical protein [Nitrospira sp.]
MRQTVNRNDLYERVWATPMRTLAAEFGISDRGLTKVCAKLNVPTPPLGYWAKKAAGKKVHQPPLPDLKTGEPQSAVINPPTKKPPVETASAEEVETVAESLSNLVLPEFPNELHRLVKQWVTNHTQEQARERREFSRPFLIGLRRIDLTERDIYRFRVTSVLFTALEAQGIKIKEADVRGAITVITDGEPLEMAVKERLQRLRPPGYETGKKWSAYGERYPSSMYPAGALRLIINTSYGGRWERRWEETDGRDFLKLIPTIVAEIIHAGPILKQ